MTARICLNMIVRNEAALIERCCRSFVGSIDHYLIADTGSTDDTVQRIRSVFDSAGIVGEVVTTTFVDFEQARNEALLAAQQSPMEFDYIALCDADMELVVDDPEWKASLTEDAYTVMQRTPNGLSYPNVRLVHRDVPARYQGATHEFLDLAGTPRHPCTGIRFIDHANGANRATKYQRDIQLLTAALELEPENPRSVFYLANSHFDRGDTMAALHWYRRRLTMAGYEDEKFISMYRIGLGFERLGDEALLLHQMMLTFETYPRRAEPMHAIALRAQRQNHHRLAYEFARMAADLAMPTDGLFVEAEVYEWRLDDIMAVSLFWMGRTQEALALNEELLDTAPASEHPRILANLEHCRAKAG